MDTTTEKAFARIKAYFKEHPKALAAAAREVGLPYTTARSALEDGRSPKLETVAKLERAIPDDFAPAEAGAAK